MGSAKRFEAVLAVLLACSGVGIGAAIGLRAFAKPKPTTVRLDPPAINFGQIGQGVVITRTVWLHNDGNKPLPIASTGSTCGCTTTKFSGEIPAHSAAPLTVRYDSHGASGSVRQAALVVLGDMQHTQIEVPLTGTVTREINASTSELSIGSNSTDATVVLSRVDKHQLTASPIELPPALEAVVVEQTNGAVRVSVKYRKLSAEDSSRVGEDRTGTHHGSVVLHLNTSRMPEFTVPVSWSVPSHYPRLPESINWGTVKPGTAVSRSVDISIPLATHPLKLEHVPANLHAFLSPVRSTNGNSSVRLSVSGTLTKGGLINDTITLNTGDTREPRLVIPVVAAVGNYADTTAGSEACRAPAAP